MKKIMIFAAIATLFVVSCNKETPAGDNGGRNLIFKASIENVTSKATLSDDLALLWSAGDEIGIYVTDEGWKTKNQPFKLIGNGGSAQGEFQYEYGDFNAQHPAFAFFPWTGSTSNDNNVYEGTMYFKMKGGAYYDYTSGQLLAPLVANLSDEDPTNIHFKYVGGVVKVSVKNVPGEVHSIGMTIAGWNIHEDFSVNPSQAGTCSVAATAGNDDTIWLNIPTASSARDYVFIFPVPTVTPTSISFVMYDSSNYKVWSKSVKNPQAIGRAEALVMPEVEYAFSEKAYYSGFTTPADYELCGSFTDWGDHPIAMVTDMTWSVARNVEMAAGAAFKVRVNNDWEHAYPSNNYVVNEAGTYNVLFNNSTHEIKLVSVGTYPDL